MPKLPITCLSLLLFACGGSAAGSAAAKSASPCHVSGSSATASTPTYTMSLATGAPERMYSPSEAAAQHPTDGEVMLRGAMTGSDGAMHAMGSMGDMGASGVGPSAGPAAGSLRHVEVHICARASGQVVSDALPTLTVIDMTTGQTNYLQVAVMQGVTAGPADLHYGNNVEIPPGHSVTLIVTLSGEDAHFKLGR